MLTHSRIKKMYPLKKTREGVSLQLIRLYEAEEFTCSRCKEDKKSKLHAVKGKGVICNGCYGELLK